MAVYLLRPSSLCHSYCFHCVPGFEEPSGVWALPEVMSSVHEAGVGVDLPILHIQKFQTPKPIFVKQYYLRGVIDL